MAVSVDRPEGEIPRSLRERKKRRTRQLLIDAAIALFTARGFDAVRLKDIAAACDVSRAAVFNYFPYGELLVLEYLDPRWLALMTPIEAAPKEGGDPVDLLVQALTLPAQGLVPKTTDASGAASWSWVIGSNTRPGTGRVDVTCAGRTVSASITIAP